MKEFQIEELLDEDLVFFDWECASAPDLLEKLCAIACEKGYVKDSYLEAVLEREEKFPTGLPTEVMKVALPHAEDKSHVIKPAIFIVKLKEPVAFKEMGDGVRDLPVEMVFLLAVNGANEQLVVLQSVVGMFSNPDTLLALKEAPNAKELINVIQTSLKK